MKIGILTFHCAHNFGAVLQCYALQETLISMGHEVDILNYRPQYLASPEPKITLKTFKCKNPFKLYYRITFLIPILKKKFKLYMNFEHKYYHLSEYIKNKEQFCNLITRYHYIVIGSDQVWNIKYNKNESIWFGDFGTLSSNTKIISYAASAGDPVFSIEELKRISSLINKFDSISVRETQLKDLLSPHINKKISCVLDPTLMISPSVWNKFQNIKISEPDPYILIYQARKDDNIFRIANQIAQKKSWNIITVDFYDNSLQKKYIKGHRNISPDQFVAYVKNAQCVITTSFHGTVFSIINNTPFYTLKLNDGADARNEEILKLLKLENRFIDKNKEIEFSEIDFTTCNQNLETLRRQSYNYLNSALNDSHSIMYR